MKKIFYCFLLLCFISWCKAEQKNPFVRTNGKKFEVSGKAYYYIGTNFWYGPILGSTGEGGNRKRLLQELDLMKKIGINNLRIYVGAEGPDNEPFRVTPTLQIAPGKYNQDLLNGLDFLLSEMKKRGQYAILYLNNSWDWSGGYSQYLNWNGYGKIPYPNVKPHTWPEFMSYAGQFLSCEQCMQEFRDHVKFILGRTNQYTGIIYTDDPTIMAWEIGNEPRAFSKENIPAFEKWISETAAYIKSLDKNHLVTTGTEGQHGCEDSYELFERIHSDANIDYLTAHIWPKNWGWLNPKDIRGTLAKSIDSTNSYLNKHIEIARRLNKPVVLEEFGLPRDFHGYSYQEKTACRDKYFMNAFKQVILSAEKRDALAGCNFWAYGGTARSIPGQIHWKRGDAYLGDPPNEEQGLNSVYDLDSTIGLIAKYTRIIQNVIK